MRSLGFFEECGVAPSVLYNWDFQPRNIIVEGGNDQSKVTGLLDWDEVLSVPLVLARKPPAWLLLPEGKMTSRYWEVVLFTSRLERTRLEAPLDSRTRAQRHLDSARLEPPRDSSLLEPARVVLFTSPVRTWTRAESSGIES